MNNLLKSSVLLVVFGCLVTGCGAVLVAGAVGGAAGGVLYAKGDLEALADNSYNEVWEASQAGLKDLGLGISTAKELPQKAVIEARRLDGKEITITIRPQTKERTKLSIRVGTFGDEASSREIYDAIKAHL
jgi:hypothetical protein